MIQSRTAFFLNISIRIVDRLAPTEKFKTTLMEMKANQAYLYVPSNNFMCNSATSGAKYRCQCAFISNPFF